MFLNPDELDVQSFLTEDEVPGRDLQDDTTPPASIGCQSAPPCQ